jgi:hypothetical protein
MHAAASKIDVAGKQIFRKTVPAKLAPAQIAQQFASQYSTHDEKALIMRKARVFTTDLFKNRTTSDFWPIAWQSSGP